MPKLRVYVPTDLCGIAPGSAVVGSPTDDGITVDFEGDVYGQGRTFAEKLVVAADRHVSEYPTVARRWLPPELLEAVGWYDTDTRALTLDGRDAAERLSAWVVEAAGGPAGGGPTLGSGVAQAVATRAGSYHELLADLEALGYPAAVESTGGNCTAIVVGEPGSRWEVVVTGVDHNLPERPEDLYRDGAVVGISGTHADVEACQIHSPAQIVGAVASLLDEFGLLPGAPTEEQRQRTSAPSAVVGVHLGNVLHFFGPFPEVGSARLWAEAQANDVVPWDVNELDDLGGRLPVAAPPRDGPSPQGPRPAIAVVPERGDLRFVGPFPTLVQATSWAVREFGDVRRWLAYELDDAEAFTAEGIADAGGTE